MNEEQRERFKELCAVWIDHLNQVISFHPADGFEQLPFATHEAQMHFAVAGLHTQGRQHEKEE